MPPKTPRQSGISLSAASTPNLSTYSFGDIVLAKVKGHPAWPARIVDPYVSPLNLRDERKISQKNTYLVKFFKTADYAWMNAKEMNLLGQSEIRAFIDNPNKKGADLKAAYQIALAPEAWEAELETFQQQYEEQQKALEIDELDPVENDGVGKAIPLKQKQKRKRPSEVKAHVTSTKKRKSEVQSVDGSAKTSATPEPSAPVAKVKKVGRKKKEEAVAPVDGESIVREWRHKLQRLFLGKIPLTEKMMPEIANVFSDIEKFEMRAEWLHSSKLAKVLKRVGVLEDSKVPLDAQFNIRARSRALQDNWRLTFGFPEDSTNRPREAEASQEKQSDAPPDPPKSKESAAPSRAERSEAADTDNDQKMTDSPGLNGAKVDVDNGKTNETALDDCNRVVDVGNDKPDETPCDEANEVVDDKQDLQKVAASDEQLPTTETESVHVNSDHQENPLEDVQMAEPDNEAEVIEEKLRDGKDEDEGEQMDCADSPEPTTVESNDAENKDKLASSTN